MKKTALVALLLACLCLNAAALAEAAPSPSLKQPTISIVVKDPTAALEMTKPGEIDKAPAQTEAPVEEETTSLVIREVAVEKMPESTQNLFNQIMQLQQQAQQTAAPILSFLPISSAVTDMAGAPNATAAPGATAVPGATAAPDAVTEEAPQQTFVPVKVDIAQIVPEETVTEIVEKLPEQVKVENLVIAEFIPLTVNNYTTDYGDVQAQVVLTTQYKPQEVATALLGVWDGEKMVWFVPELIVDENGVYMQFTEEMLMMMQDYEPVLMILNDAEAMAAAQAEAAMTAEAAEATAEAEMTETAEAEATQNP